MLAARKVMMGGGAKMEFIGLTSASKSTSGSTLSITPHASTGANDLVLLFMGVSSASTTPTPPAGFTNLPSTGGGLLACTGMPGVTPLSLTGLSGLAAVAVALTYRKAAVNLGGNTYTASIGATTIPWNIGGHASDAILIGVNALRISSQTVGLPTGLPDFVDLLGAPLRNGNAGLQVFTGSNGGAAFSSSGAINPAVTSGTTPATKMIALVKG